MHNLNGGLSDRVALLSVLVVSGCIGFAFGLSNSTWQVTVETAQVLTGVVEYPKDNPFYMYHIKVFTIINHFCAFLLRIGFSERAVSILISGLLGLVSFEAIGTVVFALSRKVFLSVLGVILIYLADLVGDGVVYPIWFMGQPHTYGILGTSFAVLSIGLLGCRAYRAGLFCIALAPCVHPSLGLWIAFVTGVCALLDWRFSFQILKKYYPYLLLGFLVTALAAAYQIHLMGNLPKVDHRIKEQYLDAFIKYWDSHRTALYWHTDSRDSHFPWGILFCLFSIFASLIGIKRFKEDRAIVLIFRIVVFSGITSLLLGILTQLPPGCIPSILLILMPGRYVNINNLMIFALLHGMLISDFFNSYKTNFKVFGLLIIGSFFSRHDEVKITVSFVAMLWIIYVYFTKREPVRYKAGDHSKGYICLTITCLVLYLAVNLPREKYYEKFIWSPEPLEDRTNNEFYETVSNRDGLLLTTHYSYLAQLKTRRAVLADMASPNFFSYAPESAIVFDHILKQVYGVDLLIPPPENLRHKEIRPELYRTLWENRPASKWADLRKEFGVTDILTPLDWGLKLPVVAKNETFVLYEIPAQAEKRASSGM